MKSKIDIGKDKSLLLKGGKILDITNGKTANKDILIHNGKIVEEGRADLIIGNPQAPLTKELVSVSPKINL